MKPLTDEIYSRLPQKNASNFPLSRNAPPFNIPRKRNLHPALHYNILVGLGKKSETGNR